MKISDVELEQLNRSFKRVFALPISRLTIRELQNALTQSLNSNIDLSKALYESLLNGELNTALKSYENRKEIGSFIDDYSPHVKIAREVAEMGEFMNSFSCDFLEQNKQFFFVNRLRRIDGTEYYFLSAPETNIRLAHMFINRLRDLKKQVGNLPLDPKLKDELNLIKTDIETLMS